MEEFNPEKIRRIKSQEKRVDNVEKAREMAWREKGLRETATLYKKFLADPLQFESEANPESYLTEEFKRMQNAGMEPEYLERLAEHHAETFGRLYDFQNTLPIMGKTRLWGEYLRVGCETVLHLYQRKDKDSFHWSYEYPEKNNYDSRDGELWEKASMIERELSLRHAPEEVHRDAIPTGDIDKKHRPPSGSS